MRGRRRSRLSGTDADSAARGRLFPPEARALLAKSSTAAADPLVVQQGRCGAAFPAPPPAAAIRHRGGHLRPVGLLVRGGGALPRWQSAAARADGEGNGGRGGRSRWRRAGLGPAGLGAGPAAAAGGSAVCAAGRCGETGAGGNGGVAGLACVNPVAGVTGVATSGCFEYFSVGLCLHGQ